MLDVLQSRLANLSLLTPGDFATVARQHRFRPLMTPVAFVDVLEEECVLKPKERKATIGFI